MHGHNYEGSISIIRYVKSLFFFINSIIRDSLAIEEGDVGSEVKANLDDPPKKTSVKWLRVLLVSSFSATYLPNT
jgi:hypothetical protein